MALCLGPGPSLFGLLSSPPGSRALIDGPSLHPGYDRGYFGLMKFLLMGPEKNGLWNSWLLEGVHCVLLSFDLGRCRVIGPRQRDRRREGKESAGERERERKSEKERYVQFQMRTQATKASVSITASTLYILHLVTEGLTSNQLRPSYNKHSSTAILLQTFPVPPNHPTSQLLYLKAT